MPGRVRLEHDMTTERLTVVRISKVETTPVAARWLIHGLWAEEAVGCIGGTPKSCKSWLALEMAVAVASGRPCLGRHLVARPGHVLVYAAEDPPHAVRDRVAGLATVRNVDLDRLAVGLITEPALRLDRDTDRARLDATLGAVKPRLLVLDPLVRLHRCDENSSGEISELLGFLREMQRRHHTAIVLVHHARKSSASQPGQGLRGSSDLHAWGDSNLYMLRTGKGLVLHAEHRSNPTPEPVEIALNAAPKPHLVVGEIAGEPPEPSALDERVLSTVRGTPMGRNRLRASLRVRNEALGESLARLEKAGALAYADGQWAVPGSHP